MGIKFKLNKQIDFIDASAIRTSFNGEEISFVETETTGYAELKVTTNMLSIFMNDVDKCDFPFMKDKACADSLLIQKTDNGHWILRVVEFKKTLNLDKLIETRLQIKNAIFKGLAIKGCLGIDDFDVIEGYCAYRENKIEESKNKNPQLFKIGHFVRAYNEWTNSKFEIKDMDIDISMKGIKLDTTGYGEISL